MYCMHCAPPRAYNDCYAIVVAWKPDILGRRTGGHHELGLGVLDTRDDSDMKIQRGIHELALQKPEMSTTAVVTVINQRVIGRIKVDTRACVCEGRIISVSARTAQ